MNDKAINKVISEYAIENANLRMAVAQLQQALEEIEEKVTKEDKE